MRGYDRRALGALGLPPDAWLYDHPGAWRLFPQKHPDKCSWCGSKFEHVDTRHWRCPTCDYPERK